MVPKMAPMAQPEVDTDKIEAVIAMLRQMTGPGIRRFVQRLRQVYRELF